MLCISHRFSPPRSCGSVFYPSFASLLARMFGGCSLSAWEIKDDFFDQRITQRLLSLTSFVLPPGGVIFFVP